MLINADKVIHGQSQSPANEYIFAGALTAATTTAVGGVIKLQNPTGKDLIITDVIIDIATASAAANSIDMGTDDDGATSSDTLLDGLAMNAVGVHDNRINGGTAGGMAVWKAGEYVVATASATLASLVGTYKIKAIAR